MNTRNPNTYNDEEDKNESHVQHKIAVENRRKTTRQKEVVEYGFEDEDELKDYARFLK